MHAAGGHASASGWVRREGSVEEQPGRELTGEVERGRQRETFACDALPIRCRERLTHGYIASLRSLANAATNPRAKGAAGPGAEGHLASLRAPVRPIAARGCKTRSVETRGMRSSTPPAEGYYV